MQQGWVSCSSIIRAAALHRKRLYLSMGTAGTRYTYIMLRVRPEDALKNAAAAAAGRATLKSRIRGDISSTREARPF